MENEKKPNRIKPILHVVAITLIIFLSILIITQTSARAQQFAPVPQTRQIQSYVTGDDGDLQMGVQWPNPRFNDNGDGTVTDHLTGLIWLKNNYCFGWQENWWGALDASNNLADGQCGLSDGSIPGEWRLPNIRELYSLVDFANHNPSLPSGHPFIGHPFDDSITGVYWSSTTDSHSTNTANCMNMITGQMRNGFSKTRGGVVWPVRNSNIVGTYPTTIPKTGQSQSYAPGDDGYLQVGVQWPDPRFTDNGDGTVTDYLTGLIWLKNANCFGLKNWDDALGASNNLADGQCGLSDGSSPGTWRLSNVRELNSLIDYGNHDPSLPSGHPFTRVKISIDYYWSSTTYAGNIDNAYSVNMAFSAEWYGFSKSDKRYTYVWPVRAVNQLIIDNRTISTSENFEECERITAGPDVTITSTGDVTFQSGKRVILRNGFSVEYGGRLSVIVDPSTCP